MPVLGRRAGQAQDTALAVAPLRSAGDRTRGRQTEPEMDWMPRSRTGFFATCANPGCRSGWLHLWRSRSAAGI